MKPVSVSELKAQLSRHIRRVQRGGEVQVTLRGKPVARLVGIGDRAGPGAARRRRLVAAGVVRTGAGKLSALLDEPPLDLPGAELSAALDDERGDRV